MQACKHAWARKDHDVSALPLLSYRKTGKRKPQSAAVKAHFDKALRDQAFNCKARLHQDRVGVRVWSLGLPKCASNPESHVSL